jgi:hypothetical protein
MSDNKLWKILDAVCTGDASVLTDATFDKDYNAFIINRALSYHSDAILVANALNERAHLDKKLQALFLINTLRPRKRYSKWVKAVVSDDARVVAEYYGCSLRRARELVSLHSSEQLTNMCARLEKGGTKTKGSRHATSEESPATRALGPTGRG